MRPLRYILACLLAVVLAPINVQAKEFKSFFNDTFEEDLASNRMMVEAGNLVDELLIFTPPDCPAFVEILEDGQRLRNIDKEFKYSHPTSCILWAFKQLAGSFTHNDFPADEPMMLVWERLDWRRHPFRLGQHWDRFAEPVYLKDLAHGVGLDWVSPWWTVGAWSFQMTIRPEGGELLYRFADYYGQADWTGDGRADLLVHWVEDSAEGSYIVARPVLLVRDGPDADVYVIDYVDWFLENRERVLSSFENVEQ